jgi:type IV secretory pathway protease TraF
MSELQGGSTAFDALSKSYETLVVEIPRDAVMSAAPDGYLDNYVLVIAELLAALPVPRPVTTSN